MQANIRQYRMSVFIALASLLPLGSANLRAQTTTTVVGMVTNIAEHTLDMSAESRTYHFLLSPGIDAAAHKVSVGSQVRIFYTQADVPVAVRIEVVN